MSRIRALGSALAVALLAGVLASAGGAVPLPRPVSDQSITTAHFVIHYYTDPSSPDYTTETQAGDIAAYAERAYALESGWGMPVPLDDGDGHIDIYLEDLSSMPGVIGLAEPDGTAPYPSPDSGAILLSTPNELAAFAITEGLTPEQEAEKAVAHELFHLFQFATWVPTNAGDYWLLEATAQWAGFDAIGFPADSVVTNVGSTDMALTCTDVLPNQMCDPDTYIQAGYSRWAFFQMLTNEYGTSFVHQILVNGAAGQPAATALANAIAAKGSSLGDQFNAYAERLMDGDFGVPAVAALRPTAEDALVGGIATGALPTVKVPVNHLAARYVTFERGDGNASHACYAATLAISVAIPAGTSAQPYFYWDVPGSAPQALNVSGSTASITVPWDTCDWGSTTRGWLSLPNASTSIDAADFTVSSSITVDPNTPATAAPPPAAATIWGTTVPVPTTDVAPSIDVFGPELLQVSSASPTIRLIVESSGPGTLNAALGTTAIGTGQLRAGNNDLRWTLPKGLVTSLRRTASATNLLTLTPMSPSGAAAGSPVLLHIVITAPAKAKKAARPKRRTKK